MLRLQSLAVRMAVGLRATCVVIMYVVLSTDAVSKSYINNQPIYLFHSICSFPNSFFFKLGPHNSQINDSKKLPLPP